VKEVTSIALLHNGQTENPELVFSEEPRIGGTLVWYASICLRQVWLMARCIDPDERNELLILGRLIDERSYPREKHNIAFGNNRFDIARKDGEMLVVSEVKKSSKSLKAATLQIKHYLYELRKGGIEARGEILFPEERRRERVFLDDESIAELENLYVKIRQTAKRELPPQVEKNRYCKTCAYNEFCWS
jgi:CRISPR-associated exonuclease Cas4